MTEHLPIRTAGGANAPFDAGDLSEPFDPESMELCEITNRVLVISPRPASLRSLVADLAVRCYDVLLLHHADDPLLRLMKGNVVIVDRSADVEPPGLSELGQTPAISLVKAAPEDPGAYGGYWIVWPSPIAGLIARIKALAALLPEPDAAGAGDSAGKLLTFKDLALDAARMTVSRGGAKIDLTRTEFDLLHSLLAAEGRVKSRDELIGDVRGEHSEWGSNTIDVHIRSLRSKLADDSRAPRYIATVRGVGYRLADG